MGNVSDEKSLRLAIQLNLVFPGLGYIYIGKVNTGIAAILLIIGIYAATALSYIAHIWIVMNAIMAIDMINWNRKNKKEVVVEQGMEKYTNFAEMTEKDAKVCRSCDTKFETNGEPS